MGVARFFQKNSADKEVSNDGVFITPVEGDFGLKRFLCFNTPELCLSGRI